MRKLCIRSSSAHRFGMQLFDGDGEDSGLRRMFYPPRIDLQDDDDHGKERQMVDYARRCMRLAGDGIRGNGA